MSAPQPPMPLAIDALLPEIISSSGSEHNHSDTQPSNRISIDYNKFRTKMCHYYIIKKPCPFGERCAFAHGDEQINTPILSSPTSLYGENSGYSSFSNSRSNLVASSRLGAPTGPIQHVIQGSASVTRVNSYGNEAPLSYTSSDSAFPPPPAYSDSKMMSTSTNGSAPPEYSYAPSCRFRYDPYSPRGFAIVA